MPLNRTENILLQDLIIKANYQCQIKMIEKLNESYILTEKTGSVLLLAEGG